MASANLSLSKNIDSAPLKVIFALTFFDNSWGYSFDSVIIQDRKDILMEIVFVFTLLGSISKSNPFLPSSNLKCHRDSNSWVSMYFL